MDQAVKTIINTTLLCLYWGERERGKSDENFEI